MKCQKCKEYTLKEKCKCGGDTLSTRPGKFSITDKYSKYRIDYKRKTQNL